MCCNPRIIPLTAAAVATCSSVPTLRSPRQRRRPQHTSHTAPTHWCDGTACLVASRTSPLRATLTHQQKPESSLAMLTVMLTVTIAVPSSSSPFHDHITPFRYHQAQPKSTTPRCHQLHPQHCPHTSRHSIATAPSPVAGLFFLFATPLPPGTVNPDGGATGPACARTSSSGIVYCMSITQNVSGTKLIISRNLRHATRGHYSITGDTTEPRHRSLHPGSVTGRRRIPASEIDTAHS